jgi:flavin reductase (DIM6/NTAB) family NADH-FMN oxidoreductase RutF
MSEHDKTDPTQFFPMPAALVTSQPREGRPNVMGIGYVGFACFRPPVVCLGINTARYSGRVIKETGECVIALPRREHVLNLDYCGFVSGEHVDKFGAVQLTPKAATRVKAPLVAECPVNLECRLLQTIPLGSHDLCVAEVLVAHVDEVFREGIERLAPIILLSRQYVACSELLCDFGESAGNPP